MFKTINIIGIAMFFILSLFSFVFSQESMTITTYYPSPYGSYRELRAQRMAIGDNYIQGGTYDWEETDGDGGEIDYLADLVVQGNVGIGTTGPSDLLHVNNSTGIARIRVSSGTTATQFIQYPTGAGAYWDNGTIGQNSIFRVSNASALDTTAMTILSTGNVGIGTTSPGEKLEVNGAIKFTGDGSVISRAPRVVETRDTRAGCPPAYTANTNIFTQSYTTSRPATVRTIVNIIACTSGRHDLYFLVDGVEKDRTLASPNGVGGDCWVGMQLESAYTVATGAHTVAVRGTATNTYGCGSTWGHISSVIFE